MTKKIQRVKKVKAWAVIVNGDIWSPHEYTRVGIYKTEHECPDKHIKVPCTITYKLPLRAKKRK